jgi:hypothetical protein
VNDELVRTRAGALPADWTDSTAAGSAADDAMAAALLAPIRAGNASAACRDAVALLTESRARAGAIWDVVHLAAAEFMLRRGNFSDVHAVTSVNALHFGFSMARTTETRLFLLLQAVGWMAHFAFTSGLANNNLAPGASILELAPPDADIPADPAAAAEDTLTMVRTARTAAARSAFAYARRHANHPALVTAARRLVFTRATDPHDYKYPAAAFEDMSIVSPAWRPHMLAASMLHLPAPTAPESRTIQRARTAVAGL